MATYLLPAAVGTLSFFSLVTALFTMSGVSLAQPSLALAAVPPAPMVAQLVGVPTLLPSSAMLSQYSTLVPVSRASRIRYSMVSEADAPISSVAPRITSS